MVAVRPSASRSRDISTRGMPWNSTTGGAGGGATVSWLGGRAFSVACGLRLRGRFGSRLRLGWRHGDLGRISTRGGVDGGLRGFHPGWCHGGLGGLHAGSAVAGLLGRRCRGRRRQRAGTAGGPAGGATGARSAVTGAGATIATTSRTRGGTVTGGRSRRGKARALADATEALSTRPGHAPRAGPWRFPGTPNPGGERERGDDRGTPHGKPSRGRAIGAQTSRTFARCSADSASSEDGKAASAVAASRQDSPSSRETMA